MFWLRTYIYLNMCSLAHQVIVEEGHGCHCLDDGHRTGQDAGVVATACLEDGRLTIQGYCRDGAQQGGDWLEGAAEVDGLTVGDASLDTS